MKTITQVCQENKEYTTLIRSVVNKIGKEYIQDVNNNGADSGFPGFTYCSDTSAFYRRHRKLINHMIEDTYDGMGYKSAIDMVISFRCMNGEKEDLIGRCIYGGKLSDETVTVENGLAWYALEEVCRMFED